ncbi:hypothetical protein vseg_014462 [Gypsophila vaccaria]
MAVFAAMALLALTQISSSLANEVPSTTNQTLGIAIQEMEKANYFAFVMLLNMVPYGKLPSNVTFLMPNNRVLAKAAIIPENDVLNFLLRHSIPSPLRFENLIHIPTESIIPSSEPNFMFRISNNGRRSFFLNNVKLISPDLCVSGSSVRCHGIDGVLVGVDKAPPLPPHDAPPMTSPSLPPPGPPLADVTPPTDTYGLAPAATPQPAGPGPMHRSSGSSHLTVNTWFCVGLFGVMVMLPMVHTYHE